MNQNSMLNILGILIGFAGIMLVLSLFVTTITQAIIHFFHIRANELQKGLANLLDLVVSDNKGGALAQSILTTNKLMQGVKGEQTSWIDAKDFKRLLEAQDKTVISQENAEKVIGWFSRMEKTVSQQFQLHVRTITLGCALFVAVIFQVSAPDVLRRLSTDPEYRAKVETTVAANLGRYESDYAALLKYEDVSAAALERLQVNHPKLRTALEEVSGIGDSKADLLGELSLVLEGHPEQDALSREYESLLEEQHQEGYNKAFETAHTLAEDLALFDITPWPKGWKFYWNFQHVLGVLMTAILIGLGAPFWFNMLRETVNLRDALSPSKTKKGKGTKTEDQ